MIVRFRSPHLFELLANVYNISKSSWHVLLWGTGIEVAFARHPTDGPKRRRGCDACFATSFCHSGPSCGSFRTSSSVFLIPQRTSDPPVFSEFAPVIFGSEPTFEKAIFRLCRRIHTFKVLILLDYIDVYAGAGVIVQRRLK